MNYRSFFLGFACCIALVAVALKVKPYCRFIKTSYRVEKENFPLLHDAIYPFSLPPLAYAYEALEPHIDARTLEIHRMQHHKTAIDNLNNALKKFPTHQHKTLIQLLENSNALPDALRDAVRTFGGSHFDHTLYFAGMSPQGGGEPAGAIAELLHKKFGSFTTFKAKFETAATSLVGSGWVWLCLDKKNVLHIHTTIKYDTPFTLNYFPLLILDVWEHAYYLKYQSKRLNYLQAWWNVVDWRHVEKLFTHATHK